MTINQTPATLLYATTHGTKAGYALLLAAGALLWWLCSHHASLLPFWAPWDFSWIEFLSGWFAVWWYVRGLAVMPACERPSLPRSIAFLAGVLAIYAVLETRFEYLAEHQFFYNRLQHVVMHHLGPLLIALAWPGAVLRRGMPEALRRVLVHPFVLGTVRILQQPALATVLFSGSFFFWLIPAIHFRAMIDPHLFAVMNWSMVAEGVLFWCLVLDPRPSPPARVSFMARAALALVVMFPQILGGAIITFSTRDLYAFYDLCGRIYPELGPRVDQAVGGLIIWIPPAMMSVVALVLVLNMLRKAEERSINEGGFHDAIHSSTPDSTTGPIIRANRWTG